MRALILEQGVDRACLASSRALHRAGWTVGVGAPFPSLASQSRYCERYHDVQAAQDGVDEYVAAAAAAVREGGYDVVFTVDDSGVIALSERRDEIPAVVPYGPHEGVLRAFDKVALSQAAARCGIETPPLHYPVDEAALPDGVPLVVKARLHLPGRFETQRYDSRDEAVGRVREIRAGGADPLVQEVIDGPLLAFVALTDRESRIVAATQQEADRVWPLGAGPPVRDRTVAVDPELKERAQALLADLHWFGLAQLQMVQTADGRRFLIDLNGRFYGSIALAIASGVNYPALWAELAVGAPLSSGVAGVTGTRYQWLARDLRVSLSGGFAPYRALESLVFATRSVHSVWSSDDPMTALRYYGRKSAGAVRDLFTNGRPGRA